MMAPNPVAAKEGGMKDYAEGCGIYVERWKGEMVERFPRNKSHPTPKQVHQVIFCVIPGKRTLDPGSSLLETPVERWKWRFSDRQYKVAALAIAPFGIAVHGGGVAKSVCHRDRRSLPNRQLRCLCRTDFGSPSIIRAHLRLYPVYLREPLEP